MTVGIGCHLLPGAGGSRTRDSGGPETVKDVKGVEKRTEKVEGKKVG